MSTLVRKTGYVAPSATTSSRPRETKRAALTTSTGGVLTIIADPNDSTATSGQGVRDNVSRIYIYESTDRITHTLRATITLGTTLAKNTIWAAELFSNNDIGIVYKLSTGALAYRKVTYATWAVSAEETVRAVVANANYRDFDISVSDGDVPVVTTYRENPSTSPRAEMQISVRRTSDSTWQTTINTIMSTTVMHPSGGWGITGQALRGGTATARGFMGAAVIMSAATDFGVRVYSAIINETTGAVTSWTLQVSGISAGDINPDQYTTQWAIPRKTMLWSSGTNQAVLGVISHRNPYKNGAMAIGAKFSFDPSTNTFGTVMAPQRHAPSVLITTPNTGVGMTYGDGAITFIYAPDSNSDGKYDLISYIMKLNADNTTTFRGEFKWDNYSRPTISQFFPMGNGSKNTSFKTHDMILINGISGTAYDIYHHAAAAVRAPAAVTPAAGSTTISSIPPISADADIDIQYPQSQYKIVWQFATDSGFTSNLREYEQTDDKFISVLNTHNAGTVVKVNDVLPLIYSMPQGTWYVRAAHVSLHGARSAWTTPNQFSISHPPSAINLAPVDNKFLQYGTGAVTISWDFTDASADDYQTAFQVQVNKVSDGSTVYDSGKVTSAAEAHTATIPIGGKDTPLYATVKLWDRDDVAGPFSTSMATFTMGDPATLSVTTPASDGSVIATAMPAITIGGTVGAGRQIRYYQISITKGADVVYTSGLVALATPLDGAFSIPHQVPSAVLKNLTGYTIQAFVVDTLGLQSATAIRNFSTMWTPPLMASSVAVDVTYYNVENAGYVNVLWGDGGRDADFTFWTIYRRADIIDSLGTVVEKGEWVEVSKVYEVSTLGYSYKDYYAPSGHSLKYRVTQTVDRFGELVESFDGVRNLARNPGAEVDASLFNTITGGTIIQDQTWDASGSNSFLFTATGGAVGTAKLTGESTAPNANRFTVNPAYGANLYARVRAKAGPQATMSGRLEISFYNSSGTIIGSTSNGGTGAGAANAEFDITHGVAIPAGTVAAEVNLRLGRSGLASFTAADQLWFDNIMISYSNVAFSDGDSIDWEWDGTPGLSQSRSLKDYDVMVVATPMSEGYWLIEPESPTADASAFFLSSVAGDSYTDEYEEVEFTIVGRGRHVDRGDHLGLKGQLDIRLRDNFSRTARQAKQRLEVMKERNRQLYMRTPFGDVYRVSAGNLGVTRIAGVGKSEHCDVTIPYSEVGA